VLAVGAPAAFAAKPKPVPGAPTEVNALQAKAKDQHAKVHWKVPTAGGTVHHYIAGLYNWDDTPSVDQVTGQPVEVSTARKTAKLTRPRVVPDGQGNVFKIKVIAVGYDGSRSPVQWTFATLQFKK
jgi:hypothetical protein